MKNKTQEKQSVSDTLNSLVRFLMRPETSGFINIGDRPAWVCFLIDGGLVVLKIVIIYFIVSYVHGVVRG